MSDSGRLTGSRASTEPVSRLGPSGFDPERIDRTAKVLRDLVTDERGMSDTIRLPEYKCAWIDEAAELLDAIAMETRRAETTSGSVEDDSAAIAQKSDA